MIGTHEFKIVAQPAPEIPSLLIIDVHHKWEGGHTHRSWMGEVKDGDFMNAITEVLKAE